MAIEPTTSAAPRRFYHSLYVQVITAIVIGVLLGHFSPETGSPFWLDWAAKNFDPRGKVNTYADIIAHFPHFQDEWLRDLQPEILLDEDLRRRALRPVERMLALG